MKDNNFNNNIEKKDNDTKKIFVVIVLLMTLMVCTTGATYAYFAISATAANNITGTAASATISFGTNPDNPTTIPTLIAPSNDTYTSLPMVPQISYTGTTNVLQKALTGASGKDKCVDDNGNVICKAYTFTIHNLSTSTVTIRGNIKFTYTSGSTFTNLRWQLMSNATTVNITKKDAGTTFATGVPVKASTSQVYFDTENVSLAANGGSKQYWLIFWIEETNANQSSTDKGTWYATINFESFDAFGNANGGVTSTITA